MFFLNNRYIKLLTGQLLFRTHVLITALDDLSVSKLLDGVELVPLSVSGTTTTVQIVLTV